jgi:hypothetical protein
MSDENQTKKETIVEVISDTKSESSKATDTVATSLDSITKLFEDIFNKKLPKLPKEFLDFIVQYMPIFNIIGIVFSVFGLLATLGLGLSYFGISAFSSLARNSDMVRTSSVGLLIMLASSAAGLYFALKAHPGLEPKKVFGWNNLYYGWLATMVIGIFNSIVNTLTNSFTFGGLGLFLLIPGFVIGLMFTLIIDALILYVIFQIRSYYNNK